MKALFSKATFIFALALWTTISMAQDKIVPKAFTINGKVKNGVAGDKAVLSLSLDSRTIVKQDSAVLAADGTFFIKGMEKEGGSFFVLNIADRQKVVLLIEGGEKLNIVADGFTKDSKGVVGKADITGSKNMDFYKKIDEMMQAFAGRVTVWNEEYAKAEEKKDSKKIQEIQLAYAKADQERLSTIKKLLPEMGTSMVALFTANNFLSQDNDLETLKKLAGEFEKVKPVPTLAQGFIGQIKRISGISVGEIAPDFTLNDPQGKPVALSSLRGKFVLIDFWASWCGPCRQENPNVVRMYERFKDKGFSIYGVSLDDNEKAWKTAIEKDKLSWVHGSELKKWNSTVAQTYGVNGIPATYLVDKEGKVIAKNLRGPALETKLTELLGAQ